MLIGVLGGGQLGRMLALAGYPLGLRFRFFDPSPYAPAGHVGELVVGDFADLDTLGRFARDLDVVTYEFENVPIAAVEWLAERVPVHPGPAALREGQDRLLEKALFRACGLEVHDFVAASTREEFHAALANIDLPAVVKTRRLGYDGKGQAVVRDAASASEAWRALGGAPLLVEEFVAFSREVSILAVRSRTGEVAFYPLVQNTHANGILAKSIAPAADVPVGLGERARAHAQAVLEKLGYVGTMAIEFFVAEHGGRTRLLANEMAPRVHNSGHWTIEGAETSQFENHLRAIAGMPLGSTAARGMSVMLNLIGRVPPMEEMLRVPGVHVHLYGKDERAGRKVGHVTVRGEDERRVREAVERVEGFIARAAGGE